MARESSDNGDKPEDETGTATETGASDPPVTPEGPEDGAATDATDPWGKRPEQDEDGTDADTDQSDTTDIAGAEEAGTEATAEAEAKDDAAESESDPDAVAETGTDETEPAEKSDAGEAEIVAEHAETEAEATAAPDTDRERPPAPPPQTVVERRGPGFVPLVLGGVVAAGLGYFASVAEVIPGLGQTGPSPEIEAALSEQAQALAALQEQISTLGAAEAPDVDLGPVRDEISGLAARLDETATAVSTLGERVATLEERPVFSGDVTADAAEAAEAVAAMEEQMRQREEEAAARAAEAEAAAEAARDAAAAAQAEAEAATARAVAEAALTELRLAVTRGDPFEGPLAAVSAIADVPPELADAASSGVVSLEALQDRFPAAARAALPVALRETAGDNPVDRVAAFLQGQVGGRAVTPREGDSVDAILSRAQGFVTDGDLDAALAEIAALPEGAQAELAAWTADAQARRDVLAALDTVTEALTGAN